MSTAPALVWGIRLRRPGRAFCLGCRGIWRGWMPAGAGLICIGVGQGAAALERRWPDRGPAHLVPAFDKRRCVAYRSVEFAGGPCWTRGFRYDAPS